MPCPTDLLCQPTPPAPPPTPPQPQDKPHPRGYVALRTAAPPAIDGDLSKPCWAAAPWSEEFLDIVGPAGPQPWAPARVKMLWDDQALYVAADLEDGALFADNTLHDSVVYRDNNFEVFIDPDGVRWAGLCAGRGRGAGGAPAVEGRDKGCRLKRVLCEGFWHVRCDATLRRRRPNGVAPLLRLCGLRPTRPRRLWLSACPSPLLAPHPG